MSSANVKLTAVNGKAQELSRGYTYTIVYDPWAGISTIAPNYNGETIDSSFGVNITGTQNINVSVSLKLPDTLYGNNGARAHITFPSSGPGGGVRIETGGFFNPHSLNEFNLGQGKVCQLRLGFIITLPFSGGAPTDTFSGVLQTRVSYLRSPNITVKDTVYSRLVVVSKYYRLSVVAKDSEIRNAVRGMNYSVAYNPYQGYSTILPDGQGVLMYGDAGINIAGEVFSNIKVQMNPPLFLMGTYGNIAMISFPDSGESRGRRAETGSYFIPNASNIFNMGGGGTCQLRLGYKFNIPATAMFGEEFTGVILCTASYLNDNSPKSKMVAEQTAITLTIKAGLDVTGVSEDQTPLQFELEQNYPNPFNPMTNFQFSLATYGHVSLKVYSMVGEEIAVVLNKTMEPGSHTIPWDASGLPSGVYLYRLSTGGFSEVRKLMVVR